MSSIDGIMFKKDLRFVALLILLCSFFILLVRLSNHGKKCLQFLDLKFQGFFRIFVQECSFHFFRLFPQIR